MTARSWPRASRSRMSVRSAVVEQRGDREDERPRGEDRGRHDGHVARHVGHDDLAAREGVGDPQGVQDTSCGSQPFEGAAEPDDADPVTCAQVRLGQRGGGANRERERLVLVRRRGARRTRRGTARRRRRARGGGRRRRGTGSVPWHASDAAGTGRRARRGGARRSSSPSPRTGDRRVPRRPGRARAQRAAQPLDAGQDAHGRVRVGTAPAYQSAAQRPADPDTGGAGP